LARLQAGLLLWPQAARTRKSYKKSYRKAAERRVVELIMIGGTGTAAPNPHGAVVRTVRRSCSCCGMVKHARVPHVRMRHECRSMVTRPRDAARKATCRRRRGRRGGTGAQLPARARGCPSRQPATPAPYREVRLR